MLNSEQKKLIHDTAERLNKCAVAERIGIIEELAGFMLCSSQTVRRYLAEEAGWKPLRKMRKDKGKSLVDLATAKQIGGVLKQATRDNGKVLLGAKNTLEIMQAQELAPEISPTTLNRKLKDYGVHPSQTKKGTVARSLRSLHPNHVWQIDASVCVLFYLPNKKVQIMEEKEFYKNKPHNLEKAARDKLIRYVITDHYSSYIYCHYVYGNEDASGVVEALMAAMVAKGNGDILQGAPKILMLDKGSGNTSGYVKSFCENLGIELIYHSTGNARAKGQVEVSNNIIEIGFEGRLKFLEIESLADLQRACDDWRVHFNSRSVLGRSGKTRSGLWASISDEMLRTAEADVLKEVGAWQKVTRKINQFFQISVATKKFGQLVYDLRDYADSGLLIGDTVEVKLNPYKAPMADISKKMYDGNDVLIVVSPVEYDDAGFEINAPVIGEEIKGSKDTISDTRIKEMAKEAYAVNSLEDVEKKKKAKEKPYQNINFMADVMKPRLYLVKDGQPIFKQEKEVKMLSRVQAAKLIRDEIPELWDRDTRESMSWLKSKYVSEVPDNIIYDLVNEFKQRFETKIVEFDSWREEQCQVG